MRDSGAKKKFVVSWSTQEQHDDGHVRVFECKSDFATAEQATKLIDSLEAANQAVPGSVELYVEETRAPLRSELGRSALGDAPPESVIGAAERASGRLGRQEERDRLGEIFELQEEFMELLRQHDRMPEWPVDLTSKPGQRLVKEVVFNMIEELAEASFTLKNRAHRLTDARLLDFEHYREELGDALAFFVEACVLSGISAGDLHAEYKRKNAVVRERLSRGY